MAENYLIAGLSLSIMFNVLVIILQVVTGVGKDALQRFMWKRKHRRGGYAYSLMATKDGNIAEVFEKVTDNKFKYSNSKEPYVREPRMLRLFRGIPANFHIEGTPSPVDPWSNEKADWALSCAEMDNVMNAQIEFDFKQWLEDNKVIIIIGGLLLIGLIGVNVYFGYMNYEALKEGAVKVASAVVSAT